MNSTDSILWLRLGLKDAGCDSELQEKFLNLRQEGDCAGGIRLLRRFRQRLLNRIHATQKKLDCLDFLLYTLEQSERRMKNEQKDDGLYNGRSIVAGDRMR